MGAMSKTTGLRSHSEDIVHPATETQPATYGSDCHVTPDETVKLVRAALGGRIDVDPFAGPYAHHATSNWRYPERDGLLESWGPPDTRAYVNPPFSGKWKGLVHRKCMHERVVGVSSILMAPSGIIGTSSGSMILGECDAFCALNRRVAFLLNGVRRDAPRGGSLLVLYTLDPRVIWSFIDATRGAGRCFTRLYRPGQVAEQAGVEKLPPDPALRGV